MTSRLSIWLIAFGTALAACAEAPFSLESTPGKLPKTIVPRRYDITVQPDLTTFTTRGSVTVDIQVLKPVNTIVLSALDMTINKATLNGDREIALAAALDPDTQTLELRPPARIAPGNYRLAIDFTGHLREQGQGLYYVNYNAPSAKKTMLCTQMEATDARRMFPCWDEPAFRASFVLTAIVPEKHVTVSNMPIERETTPDHGLKKITFAPTPLMPSYLVALVSGELEELAGEAEGVRIRVITTEGKKEQGRFALEATEKLLTYYNQYFGIKYPLPKLDQIAIPGGFDGAMENWGAITCDEADLLFDPSASSRQTKRDIFVTVAHEMAHQWFGDLVTMAWWDNIWLNEGFASWMEIKATDHFHPDWQMWLSADSEKSSVMSRDARRATHPIQQPVRDESAANDAFDDITYQKGRAVLRMLESYLGEEDFRRGVHDYLAAHSYSNTTTADLWDALGKASGKPVKAISAGWTEQPGLPVVNVSTRRVKESYAVRLEQERFTVNDPGAPSLTWAIPVDLMDAKAAHPENVQCVLLNGRSSETVLPDPAAVPKANAGDTGYYRVRYEPALAHELAALYPRLPDADRFNLMDDSWAMVEGGRSSAVNFLDLADSIRNEKLYAIWQRVLDALEAIDHLEQDRPGRGAFDRFARSLLKPQMARLGWEARDGEPDSDALLRGALITALGDYGDRDVIAEAGKRFEKFPAAPDSLSADLRPFVLNVVARYSDQKTYDEIHKLALAAGGTEERQMYYRAMTRALDTNLARETLALSLTNEASPQEATALVGEVAHNGGHPALAWDYFLQHAQALLARVDAFERNNYVPGILDAFSDAQRADELEAWVKKNLPASALAKARESAEAIRFKAALKARELPAIDKWVAAGQKPSQ